MTNSFRTPPPFFCRPIQSVSSELAPDGRSLRAVILPVEYIVLRRCAWCGDDLPRKRSCAPVTSISHGICHDCMEVMHFEIDDEVACN